jgi:hypothetical protein
MPSPLPQVRPSEPIRAPQQNELVRRVNALSHLAVGGPLVAAQGAGGTRAALRDLRRIAIWELTGPMDRPQTGGVTDDVPSAPADAVWYFDADGYAPENKYQGSPQHTRSGRVYHVGGLPGDQRDQLAALEQGVPGCLATPLFTTGDWVYAEFNPQSARWEIMSPPETVWRFELKTPLVPSDDRDVPSTAAAWLVVFDPDQGKYVTTDVEFSVADFLGVCHGEPGHRGYAKRLADSHLEAGWEVLVMVPEESSSSGEPAGLTTSIDVVLCDPYRVGDYLCFPQKRLSFLDGVLVEAVDLDDTQVYACCPDSSSGA